MFKRMKRSRYIRVVFRSGAWRRFPVRLYRWTKRISSTHQYELVQNEEVNTKSPLYDEKDFECGISFHAKYIGTLDVPRPDSRVEIVAAMRKVRYEFKARGAKKRKVTIDISKNGVRVCTRAKIPKGKIRALASKLFRRKSQAEDPDLTEGVQIMHHPIHRIFYVSHDSSDLKVFSYIARDGPVFKCNVFKSKKKNQAMRIVRTVGQAFEICHKTQDDSPDQPVASTSSAAYGNISAQASEAGTSKASESGSSEFGAASSSKGAASSLKGTGSSSKIAASSSKEAISSSKEATSSLKEAVSSPKEAASSSKGAAYSSKEAASSSKGAASSSKGAGSRLKAAIRPTSLNLKPTKKVDKKSTNKKSAEKEAVPPLELIPCIHIPKIPDCLIDIRISPDSDHEGASELTNQNHLRLLKERLKQQAHQTREAVAQIMSLRDQLLSEQNARCEAQSRTYSLLMYNKELLDHISLLVKQLHECEKMHPRPINTPTLTLLPEGASQTTSITIGNPPPMPESVKSLLAEMNQEIGSSKQLSPAHSSLDEAIGISPSLDFGDVSDEAIQNFLIKKFEELNFAKNDDGNVKEFFQNKNAFPEIPPLSEDYSNEEIERIASKNTTFTEEELQAAASSLTIGYSNCLENSSSSSSSNSSTDGVIFIMPLSNNETMATTGDDGRTRLIVPVSPTDSRSALLAHTDDHPADNEPSTSAPLTSERAPNQRDLIKSFACKWPRFNGPE